jgi:hypothetical protein
MLTDMLCKEIGKDDLKLNSKVLSLSYSCDGNSALENWSVTCASDRDKHSQTLSVDAVIMTVSTYLLSRRCFSTFMCFLSVKLHSGYLFLTFFIVYDLCV